MQSSCLGKPWYDQEEKQLIKEYTVDKLSISDICKIHERTQGGIKSRLKKLELYKFEKKLGSDEPTLREMMDVIKDIQQKVNMLLSIAQ